MIMEQKKAACFAVLSAALYSLSLPFSKLLLGEIPPTLMAGLLYLGAGTGMLAVESFHKLTGRGSKEQPLTRNELPYIAGMLACDTAAPILLMAGLLRTSSAEASLLNNFETAATSLIALAIFKEAVSRRLWVSIALVTASSAVLTFDGSGGFSLSAGALLILLAGVCWGFENNFTRRMSGRNPLQIVVLKGLWSGFSSVCIGLLLGERCAAGRPCVMLALLLGFLSYGLSITFYVYAQRTLGAAKTCAYFAFAPFIGAAFSFVIFLRAPNPLFWPALALMAAGTYFAATEDKHERQKRLPI